jgi:DNA-binding NtrC family response regulator
VDDERVVADTLSAILDLHGYAVMTAYDPHSAFEMARLVPPELLITDMAMPRMNGIDLAIKIRLAAPDCEVILFSGHEVTVPLQANAGRPGHAFSGNTLPGSSFIALKKPLPPTLLLARVAECFRHREDTSAAAIPSGAVHRASTGPTAPASPAGFAGSTEHCRVFRPGRQHGFDSHMTRPH